MNAQSERLRLVREEGLAFELRIPGQPLIQIFLNGKVVGVAEGTRIINWYPIQRRFLLEGLGLYGQVPDTEPLPKHSTQVPQ